MKNITINFPSIKAEILSKDGKLTFDIDTGDSILSLEFKNPEEARILAYHLNGAALDAKESIQNEMF